MNEKRIVPLRILDQPLHRSQDIGFCWDTHGVLLVVGQDDHVFSPVAVSFMEEGRHVGHIVDTAAEGVRLPGIVNPNQQGLPSARTSGVLEAIVGRSSLAELLRLHGRAWGHLAP